MKPKLKLLRHTGDFRIAVAFTDGLVTELDFSELLNAPCGPMLEALQNEAFFGQAFIDHGIVTWPNGYDVCPDILRFWAESGRVTSQVETDAHFSGRSAHAQSVA